MSVSNQVDQSDSHDHQGHSKKHMILMMLCCVLPVVAIVAVGAIFPQASYLNLLFLLVCPLMMVAMMIPNWLSKKKSTNKSCH